MDYFFLDTLKIESSQNLQFSFVHIITVKSVDSKEQNDLTSITD